MPTTIRRITNTTGTIPAGTALAGTVTTDAVTTVLIYSGSEDILALVNEGINGQQGFCYIYVPTGTPKLSKILGVYDNGSTVSITLETAIPSLSSAACQFVKANLSGYSWLNDGASNGTVDGIAIEDGEHNNVAPTKENSMGQCQLPVYVDATGTDFLITQTVFI